MGNNSDFNIFKKYKFSLIFFFLSLIETGCVNSSNCIESITLVRVYDAPAPDVLNINLVMANDSIQEKLLNNNEGLHLTMVFEGMEYEYNVMKTNKNNSLIEISIINTDFIEIGESEFQNLIKKYLKHIVLENRYDSFKSVFFYCY